MKRIKKMIAFMLIFILSSNSAMICKAETTRVGSLNDFKTYLSDHMSDLKSDPQGVYILYMYLFGASMRDLSTKTITISGKQKKYPVVTITSWGKYMRKDSKFKKQVYKLLSKHFKNIKNGKSKKISLKVMGKMKNGESIIGTQYLHYSSPSAGNLSINGTARNGKNGKVTAKLYFVWNDIIDPNYVYSSDTIKTKFAKQLPYADPTDYIIKIKWNCTVIKDPSTGRDNNTTWPFTK